MLGAAALAGLAAMRTGAGMVTLGVPKSLNDILQKKISPVIMTLPLPETKEGTLAFKATPVLFKNPDLFSVAALGPGLSQNTETQKFIRKFIARWKKPLVIDADALQAFASPQPPAPSHQIILTPHPGEMARLIGKSKNWVEAHRRECAIQFARKNSVVLLLKGHRTIVANSDGKTYINKTGNSGMATAGSGDVLTGMIAALLAQGLDSFNAAKLGAFLHGKAGDIAAKNQGRASLIATDIIEAIPKVIKNY